jgi:hypothetical protein
MMPQLSIGFAVRGLIVVAAATLVSLPQEALALPRDRIAARRLARILPPGSTLTVPAAPVPPRRPAVVRVPAKPATPPAQAASPVPQPAPVAAAKPTQPPAAASGVQQAGGAAPAAKGVTPTGAWTLDDAPAADGTKSVLVPESQQPTPADPIELLPTP